MSTSGTAAFHRQGEHWPEAIEGVNKTCVWGAGHSRNV